MYREFGFIDKLVNMRLIAELDLSFKEIVQELDVSNSLGGLSSVSHS
jgi:hypothetical protein